MKLRTETINWFKEMWVAVAVGVAEAALIVMAVPHLFNDWNELGRIVAITALAKFFYFIRQSPLPRQPVNVVMSGPDATLQIDHPQQQKVDVIPIK